MVSAGASTTEMCPDRTTSKRPLGKVEAASRSVAIGYMPSWSPAMNKVGTSMPAMRGARASRSMSTERTAVDSAATALKPQVVIDAVTSVYAEDCANIHRAVHVLSQRATARYEGARDRVRDFLGAKKREEIVFTRGTTEGVNLAAQAWCARHLQPGDVILTTGMEHHSNLVPWQLAAQRNRASLRHIPVLDDGTLDMDALDSLLDGPVRLLAFVHVSNSLGTINPAREICARARATSASVRSTVACARQSSGWACPRPTPLAAPSIRPGISATTNVS